MPENFRLILLECEIVLALLICGKLSFEVVFLGSFLYFVQLVIVFLISFDFVWVVT